jgi:hypothetical protein
MKKTCGMKWFLFTLLNKHVFVVVKKMSNLMKTCDISKVSVIFHLLTVTQL